ncbi:flavin-containing monooxygenase [Sciscionella marina]|uniref:flavin-containing monooxygenase n=1 Tax=Sciscionella marina TaxID=508770 RepID=UPI00036F70C8|nr:NAD(P)/FAD-dependent oxidoreductase [Sciscionella marina]
MRTEDERNGTGIVTEIAIVGSGFSGMCTAIKLAEAGITDYVILEKAEEVGGTWRENTYPGCTVDVASPLYSFSFEPNPDWSRTYAGQEELLGYARELAAKYRLRERTRFGTEVLGGSFDEDEGMWSLETSGAPVRARIVVLACISLHFPHIPEIPGRDRFTGPSFHSARWRHDYDFTGKRVASFGTGASAVQFVPQLAKRAERLTVYQRSAGWVLPKLDLELTAPVRAAFRNLPLAQKALRAAIFSGHELLHHAQFNTRLLGAFEALCLRALRNQVPDPETRAKLTPDYRFSCKRPMVANDYYRTFSRDNVDLITDRVTEIDATGVIDETGRRTEVDAIVWGTGFHVQDMYKYFPDLRVDGDSLVDRIDREGLEGYRGIAMRGAPNVFTVVGPNSVRAHTSFLLTIEANSAHVVRLIAAMRRQGISRIEIGERAQREFTEWAHGTLREAVWSIGGCTSYFIDENRVNRIAWPGSAPHQRLTMRGIDLRQFDVRYGQGRTAGRSGWSKRTSTSALASGSNSAR